MKTAELNEKKKKKRKPVKSIFSNIVRVPWDEPFRKPRSEQISECIKFYQSLLLGLQVEQKT